MHDQITTVSTCRGGVHPISWCMWLPWLPTSFTVAVTMALFYLRLMYVSMLVYVGV
jgi:hypothetical protein